MNIVLAVAAAYFVGAIPTSFLAARHGAGIDLRTRGSKNLGTTNLYRVLGWKYAVPVGIFDVAKGFLPVLLLGPRVGSADWIPLAIGVSAVLGHGLAQGFVHVGVTPCAVAGNETPEPVARMVD